MYARLGDGASLSVPNQSPLHSGSIYDFTGWGNSILALICLVIGCPAPFVFYRYGARLRSRSNLQNSEITCLNPWTANITKIPVGMGKGGPIGYFKLVLRIIFFD
jgi:hypothetical protein